MKRRDFIQNSLLATAAVATRDLAKLVDTHGVTRLTILHTNDQHSRVEPFPDDDGRNANMGGIARRAQLIKKIRKAEDQVLLLDSGDIFQGTPYFNFFHGEVEIKAMSEMGYDACTIGNHDFDGGIEGLYAQLPNANFPFLMGNYDFSNTIMAGKTQEYKTFQKGNAKIGVFGIGIELDGLVPKSLYKETQFLDPIKNANRIASHLKNEEKCDLIICLSHLGYKYRNDTVSDVVLAENSKNIDVILGGHTHTFMYEPDIRRDLKGEEVVINQAGWAGIMLGRLDIWIEKNKKGKCISCKNTYVG